MVDMRWGRGSSLPALSESQDLTSMGELAAAPSSERGSAGVEKETVRLPHSPASMSPPLKWGRLPTEDISSSSEASSTGVELERSSEVCDPLGTSEGISSATGGGVESLELLRLPTRASGLGLPETSPLDRTLMSGCAW